MPSEFKLPDLGEGVHEGQVIKLLVSEGDTITEDQPLMEVETDKAAVEIPSPFTGTVTRWHVAEQQVVNVGDVMVTVETDSAGASAKKPAAASAKKAAAPPSRASTTTVSATTTPTARHKPASPAVRKRARTLGIDLNTIVGSGPGGRVTRADVDAAASGPSAASQPALTTAPVVTAPPSPEPPTGIIPPGDDDADAYGPVRRHPISQARKTIAANMTAACSSIPHVTDSDDADVTDLDALRRGYPSAENGHRKITMLAFILRAVARALRHYPEFNAWFDAENQHIVYRRYVNLAVGVHTERGLVAPVIRNADQLTVLQIADVLVQLTEKARTASFAVNDTRGGTYTISNAGAFGGSRYSTPIITPGQCAVLAIGRSRLMPWVRDGEIVPRLIMPLSHSFDHRLADGGQEIAFMQMIIGALENPARLLMDA